MIFTFCVSNSALHPSGGGGREVMGREGGKGVCGWVAHSLKCFGGRTKLENSIAKP